MTKPDWTDDLGGGVAGDCSNCGPVPAQDCLEFDIEDDEMLMVRADSIGRCAECGYAVFEEG